MAEYKHILTDVRVEVDDERDMDPAIWAPVKRVAPRKASEKDA